MKQDANTKKLSRGFGHAQVALALLKMYMRVSPFVCTYLWALVHKLCSQRPPSILLFGPTDHNTYIKTKFDSDGTAPLLKGLTLNGQLTIPRWVIRWSFAPHT